MNYMNFQRDRSLNSSDCKELPPDKRTLKPQKPQRHKKPINVEVDLPRKVTLHNPRSHFLGRRPCGQ